MFFLQLPASIIICTAAVPQGDFGGVKIFAAMLILIGLVSVVYPRLFWYLRVGRKVPWVIPSPIYLALLRFGGILVVALGVYVLYYLG